MSCSAKEITSTIISGPCIHGVVELTVVIRCVNEPETLGVELKRYRRGSAAHGDSRSNGHRPGFQTSLANLSPLMCSGSVATEP